MTIITWPRGKTIADVMAEDPRWVAWACLTVRSFVELLAADGINIRIVYTMSRNKWTDEMTNSDPECNGPEGAMPQNDRKTEAFWGYGENR